VVEEIRAHRAKEEGRSMNGEIIFRIPMAEEAFEKSFYLTGAEA